jgi:hypothetical protein
MQFAFLINGISFFCLFVFLNIFAAFMNTSLMTVKAMKNQKEQKKKKKT